MLSISARITSKGITQTDCSTNITSADLIDIFTVIGMHTQQPTNALTLPLNSILNRCTLCQRPRINTQVRETTNKWIGDNLEDQCTERCLVINCTYDSLTTIGIDASGRSNIQRRRQVCYYSIQYSLHALVLQRTPAQYRYQSAFNRCFAQSANQLFR